MDVVAIMPCRGRVEQTVANVRRLLATAWHTAGYEGWRLVCVMSQDEPALCDALLPLTKPATSPLIVVTPAPGTITYWDALATITKGTDATLLVNLANDLIPGRHWLKRGIDAYRARFGDGDGLMGFNDGLHGPEHSSHFLISRALLDRYGGWPVWYQHNFGDTELCRRAQRDGCYGKAPWAVLFHDHLENGAADDAIYQEGRASYNRDERLFDERRRAGWPR